MPNSGTSKGGTNLRETEIRPDELMKEQAARYARDVARLMAKKAAFVEVGCPACEAKKPKPEFEKFGLNYVRCGDCETMYVSPRPTNAHLEDYYSNSENYDYWNKYIFPQSENARREKIFKPRAEKVAEICKRNNLSTGTLLEVGSGFGTFCEEIKRLGLFRKVVAVEPTPNLAATCRAKGIEVIEKPIEQVKISEIAADVVASFEVIEHLFSPKRFLMDCHSVLAKDGVLIVTCPNVKGFDIATLGKASNTVDTEHLNYFHPASLASLLSACGFKVIESVTPGKLDAELVRKKVLAGEASLKGQPFLQEVLIDRWDDIGVSFQNFLVENGLSSNMWIVAKKA